MFDKAVDYILNYQISKNKAYWNKETDKWFTSGVSSVNELIEDIFDSKQENEEWIKAKESNDLPHRLAMIRIKIGFLSGGKRDLRDHFAVKANNDIKTTSDIDRHASGIIRSLIFRLKWFRKIINKATQS